MAIDNLQNGSDENPLSGAYIRSFVKQLTNSSKPNLNTTQNLLLNNNNDTLIVGNYHNNNHMTTKTTSSATKKQAMTRPNHQLDHAQGHKKQVRRRLHTSRPYQERLLNMAEARKEIVTALKYHRASMKQASDRKQALQNDHRQQVVGRDHYESSRKVIKREQLSEENNNVGCYYYPTHYNNNYNYNQNFHSSNIPTTTTPILYDSLNNIPLPNQTLGLNLNLQAFTNLDTNFSHSVNTTPTTTTTNNNSPSLVSSSPSSSSSPLSIPEAATTGAGPTNIVSRGTMDMHPTLDEEEIAKMRSIGEQHQMEWDDTLNLVKSAWWFNKYHKTVDFGKEIKDGYHHNINNINNSNDYDLPFGELMEIPPWLSPNNNESLLQQQQQQQIDDSSSEDTTLPWMDIGDIDGMDDEWLS